MGGEGEKLSQWPITSFISLHHPSCAWVAKFWWVAKFCCGLQGDSLSWYLLIPSEPSKPMAAIVLMANSLQWTGWQVNNIKTCNIHGLLLRFCYSTQGRTQQCKFNIFWCLSLVFKQSYFYQMNMGRYWWHMRECFSEKRRRKAITKTFLPCYILKANMDQGQKFHTLKIWG